MLRGLGSGQRRLRMGLRPSAASYPPSGGDGPGSGPGRLRLRQQLYGPEFLLRRPLLEAIDPAVGHPGGPPVLLIDELDRADEEFEAFLLEVLSDFQITLPELGTLAAEVPPVVIVTSNRTRELHDALRRRCLYQWIDYPDFDKELEIVRTKAPGSPRPFPSRLSPMCRGCARKTSSNAPGWPRPSTGPLPSRP